MFRDDLYLSIADDIHCRLSQGVHPDKPLGGDHGLDDLAAPLRPGDVEHVGRFFNHQPRSTHIFPEIFSALKPVLPLVRASKFIYPRGFIEHRENFQPMPLPDFIIVWIVTRGDLKGPGAELPVDVIVGDNRDLTPENGHNDMPAHKLAEAFVLRMYR